MNKHKNSIRNWAWLMIFCLSSLSIGLQAQSLEEARTMISEKDYAAAEKAFEHLITKYKSRADVNKWYGEALFETGQYTKAKPYLTFAAKRRILGAYNYLAQIAYLEYNFEEAAAHYDRYKKALRKGSSFIPVVDSMKHLVALNKKALQSVERVIFIDSIVVDKKTFFTHYNLGTESGKLHARKDAYAEGTPLERGVLFESQRKDKLFYSKANEGNGFDIYEQSKLLGDQWSPEKALPAQINTAYNEAFPYMLTDGATIYYGSNQPGGLGGYDLYITRYNASTGAYFRPEHLSMPFNSPYNDYMLAIDEINQVGWFATDRFQPKDKVVIYLFIAEPGQKDYYADLSPEQQLRAARIASIKETWETGQNYRQLLQTIYNQANEVVAKEKSLHFVINDQIVYHTEQDFRSKEARTQLELAQKSEQDYVDTTDRLDQLRFEWTKADASGKNSLRPQILQLEQKTTTLQQQIATYKKNARRIEIEMLRKQQ